MTMPDNSIKIGRCLVVVLSLSFFLGACTNMVPRKNLPYPLTNDTFDDQVKMVTIPLPVIASSPNEGVTLGALSAFLLHNSQDEVSTLMAPQINYNKNFGVTTILYGAFYPTPERQWRVNLAKATKINQEYRFRYSDREFLSDKFDLEGEAVAYTDGSARFFGFQSTAKKENETNYSDQELGGEASVGYRLFDKFKLIFGERAKKVDIKQGAIKGIPFITDKFTAESVPGINGFVVHAQKISAVYSTLDSDSLPTSGWQARASVETSWQALGSSADYQVYEAEFKYFYPFADAHYITVARLAGSQVSGDSAPFLEKSTLGGETTLRGYGRYRFIDNSYLLLNLEERIRLFRWRLFNVLSDWELAPFVDIGSVMSSLSNASPNSFQINVGIGFRAVVRPNIIGRVDVGVGNEGPAVFVGLGYPF
ncbi:BamA/TamA family outer membrane protein [Geobacter sp. SVR]|uniref:BamA/TamA family outer membrane protein n=1 Tax=Geobacter sp. SVR TaxID=2495594 RepID=UPI00143EF88B|nr:BamA/TamA family outer membrane protein [Geobacter sp. SVR]BCS52920.1 membrane protein [Geobacter sp. SVR]GCF84304.1 membrane protein [Geobacter sp. SVR]